MRRFCFAAFLLCFVGQLSAQGLFDALRFSDNSINGTARYMSMAGAFGALGGDPTSIMDNPAGLAIYRGSEVTFTLNAIPSVSESNWGRRVSTNDFHFNLNNLSFIFNIPSGRESGYLCSNFSLIYNRLHDYTRSVRVYGNSNGSITDYMAGMTTGLYPSQMSYSNIHTPYLSVLGYETYLINPLNPDSSQWSSLLNKGEGVTSGYRIEENGYIDEYNLAYGGNVNNFIYYGISLSMQSLFYQMNSIYGERFDNGGDMALNNSYQTSGLGWNFKFGFIVRPLSWMRIGFSFQTPTWYNMNEDYVASTTSTIGSNNYSNKAPIVNGNYRYNAPLKLQASMAFVFGKKGILSLEYNFTDYKNSMRYRDYGYNSDIFLGDNFGVENNEIKNFAKDVHAIKVGAEYRVTSQFPIRLGVAYYTPSMESNSGKVLLNNTTRTDVSYFVDHGKLYAAAGLGYRYNGFGIDLAYQYRLQMQRFAPYQSDATLYDYDVKGQVFGVYGSETNKDVTVADVKTSYHNIVLTLSYKF